MPGDTPEQAEERATRRLVQRTKAAVGDGKDVALARLGAARERHTLVDLAVTWFERDRESAGGVLGSAVAFRLFLFFAPFVLFIVGVFSVVVSWVDADDLTETAGVTGNLAAQIEVALESGGVGRWFAIGLGLFGAASAGRSLTKVLVAAAALTWQLPVRRQRATLRVVGSVVGFLAAMSLMTMIVNRIREVGGLAAGSVSFAVMFGFYAVAWLFVGLSLPRATPDPGAQLPGALLVAGIIAGLQAVTQLYLPGRFDRALDVYGAVGITIVTLGWFFLIGRSITLSMALNAVVYERLGSVSQAVFALPVVRILPRRSAKVRQFFGLDRQTEPSDG